MARRPFGGNQVVADAAGNILQFATGTVWTTQTGGSQITDLLDASSTPETVVTTDAFGAFLFQGPPDGTAKVYLDFGGGERFYSEATDTTDRLAVVEAFTASTVTSADITGLQTQITAQGVTISAHTTQLATAESTTGAQTKATTALTTAEAYADTQDALGPRTIDEVAGVYPLRTTATSSSTQVVRWRGPDAPGIGSGYALTVDEWLRTTS